MRLSLVPRLTERLHETIQQWRERMVKCSDSECARARSMWQRISRRTCYIRLHSAAFCVNGCFERALQHRLQRVSMVTIPALLPSHRLPLGLLMLSRGQLSNHQLRRALDAQRQNGSGRIGEWLHKLGFAHEQDISAALAKQWSCPVMKLLPSRLPDAFVPFHLLQRFRMVPVHFTTPARVLHVAFAGDIQHQALVAIEQVLSCKAEACLTTRRELDAALARIEAQHRRRTDKVFGGSNEPEDITRVVSGYAEKLAGSEVRVARCADVLWIRIQGVDQATDLLFHAEKQIRSPWWRRE